MIRTIGSYLAQSGQTQTVNLQVRRFRARIIDVLFGGHSFAVVAPGYSGPTEVPADASIDFGTANRPLVFVNNDVMVEMDATGRWHATQYIQTNRCVPVTSGNVPNIPLPTYRPPIDTSTIFNIPRVDASFSPHSIAMAQLVPSTKMPPASGSSYDYSVDYHAAITSGNSLQFHYEPVIRTVTFGRIGVTSPDQTGISFVVKVNNSSIITVTRTAGTWTINSVSSGTADTVVKLFATPVSVTYGGLLESIITASANLTGFGAVWGP